MISIWEKETFFAPQDVIIVGSGLVGLWSALYIKKKHPKAKVTVIDRGLIPTGASTRNAGFACFGSLTELIYDIQTMGIDKTLQLVEMRYEGLQKIQKFFTKSTIDFDLCGGYELLNESDNISLEKLENDIAYLNSLLKSITDSKHTYKIENDKIEKFGFAGITHLIKNNFEGYLHSGKLVQALLQQVQSMGVNVINGIEIKAYEEKNNAIEVTTNQDFNFLTKQLLICTNAAKDLLPLDDIVPARGQVLLTSPIKDLSWKGSFHFDEGFYYFRNLDKRVLLGGARNKAFEMEQTFDLNTTEFIQNELERFLREIILPNYKDQYTIEYRWSGIMGMGSEKMPVVKQIQSNVFCAVRMSGMGVALAPVVAQQVTKMMFS